MNECRLSEKAVGIADGGGDDLEPASIAETAGERGMNEGVGSSVVGTAVQEKEIRTGLPGKSWNVAKALLWNAGVYVLTSGRV